MDNKQLEKWLLPLPMIDRKPSQIDYILVSNRWRSSIVDSKVRWGPSLHRNIHGKADHALVMCKWFWRVRKVKTEPSYDWSVLTIKPPRKIESSPEMEEEVTPASTCPSKLNAVHQDANPVQQKKEKLARLDSFNNNVSPVACETNDTNLLVDSVSACACAVVNSNAQAKVVTRTELVPTKPLEGCVNMEVKGCIAQHPHCLAQPDRVRGMERLLPRRRSCTCET